MCIKASGLKARLVGKIKDAMKIKDVILKEDMLGLGVASAKVFE